MAINVTGSASTIGVTGGGARSTSMFARLRQHVQGLRLFQRSATLPDVPYGGATISDDFERDYADRQGVAKYERSSRY